METSIIAYLSFYLSFRFYFGEYDDPFFEIDGRVFKFPVQGETKAVQVGENISGIRGVLIKTNMCILKPPKSTYTPN